MSSLFEAASRGDLVKVNALLKNNPELVSSKGNLGETPLLVAAAEGQRDVAAALLDNGADINAKNKTGETPLHWASHMGHRDVATFLLAKKAQVNAVDNFGVTPLHMAASAGHEQMVEMLLEKGADAMATSDFGTPLHLAVSKRYENVADMLRKRIGRNLLRRERLTVDARKPQSCDERGGGFPDGRMKSSFKFESAEFSRRNNLLALAAVADFNRKIPGAVGSTEHKSYPSENFSAGCCGLDVEFMTEDNTVFLEWTLRLDQEFLLGGLRPPRPTTASDDNKTRLQQFDRVRVTNEPELVPESERQQLEVQKARQRDAVGKASTKIKEEERTRAKKQEDMRCARRAARCCVVCGQKLGWLYRFVPSDSHLGCYE